MLMNVILLAVAVVLLALYVGRRRSRLRRENSDR